MISGKSNDQQIEKISLNGAPFIENQLLWSYPGWLRSKKQDFVVHSCQKHYFCVIYEEICVFLLLFWKCWFFKSGKQSFWTGERKKLDFLSLTYFCTICLLFLLRNVSPNVPPPFKQISMRLVGKNGRAKIPEDI